MTLQQAPQQSQHFLLKWNNHRSNMVNVFESLLQAENLVDVTLAVEGKFLKAHRIVLSACSPYFQSMFVNHTPAEKHPIIVFHDMKHAHLTTLLQFMYKGEISIDEKDLSDVLKVAEALSVRGLSSFESDDEEDKEENGSSSNNNNNNQQQSNNNNNSSSSNSSSNNNNNQSVGGNASQNSTTHNHNNNSSGNTNQSSSTHNFHNGNHHSNDNQSGSCDSNSNGNSSGKCGTKRSSGASNVKSASPVVAKRKRGGRQPKVKAIVPDILPTSTLKREGTPKVNRYPPPDLKPVSDLKPALPARQGVRRRIPRRYAPIKREKMSDNADDPELFGLGLLPDMVGSEPLSEMSVRGLDLFKYASIEDSVYRCNECEKLRIPKTFKNKYSFQRHAFLYHEGNMRKVFPCPVCSREFSRPDKMKNHLKSIHEGNKGTPPDAKVDRTLNKGSIELGENF